jgi:hypothetical protein
MARKTPNYKRQPALEAIRGILPICIEDWKRVCEGYRIATNEDLNRDPADFRRYFYERMCNKNKKVTGNSGENCKVLEAQKVQQSMLAKANSCDYGGQSSDDEGSADEAVEEDDGPVDADAPAASAKKTRLKKARTKNSLVKKRSSASGAILEVVKAFRESVASRAKDPMVNALIVLMQQNQQLLNAVVSPMRECQTGSCSSSSSSGSSSSSTYSLSSAASLYGLQNLTEVYDEDACDCDDDETVCDF